jgi:hypothetical protein
MNGLSEHEEYTSTASTVRQLCINTSLALFVEHRAPPLHYLGISACFEALRSLRFKPHRVAESQLTWQSVVLSGGGMIRQVEGSY